jgi:hypothetical protein
LIFKEEENMAEDNVQVGGVIDYYKIERTKEIFCKRFNHTGTEHTIKFHSLPNDLVQLD